MDLNKMFKVLFKDHYNNSNNNNNREQNDANKYHCSRPSYKLTFSGNYFNSNNSNNENSCFFQNSNENKNEKLITSVYITNTNNEAPKNNEDSHYENQ